MTDPFPMMTPWYEEAGSLAASILAAASPLPAFPYGPFVGAMVVSAFAVGWVFAGTRSLPGRWPVTLSLSALAISAVLGWRDYHLLRAGMHVPAQFHGAAYGAAVAFESLAIPLSAALLKRHGKVAYLLPAIALIVGIHFFGLVRAFDSPGCGWIGGAMCLLALTTVSTLPPGIPREADRGETRLWDVVTGLGCAVILWIAVATQF